MMGLWIPTIMGLMTIPYFMATIGLRDSNRHCGRRCRMLCCILPQRTSTSQAAIFSQARHQAAVASMIPVRMSWPNPCTNWHDWRPNAVAMAASVSARVAVSWVPGKFPGLQNPALSLGWSLCCVPRESMECIRTNPNTLQEFQDVVAVGTI